MPKTKNRLLRFARRAKQFRLVREQARREAMQDRVTSSILHAGDKVVFPTCEGPHFGVLVRVHKRHAWVREVQQLCTRVPLGGSFYAHRFAPDFTRPMHTIHKYPARFFHRYTNPDAPPPPPSPPPTPPDTPPVHWYDNPWYHGRPRDDDVPDLPGGF